MTQIPSYLDPEIAPFQLSFNTSPWCNNWSVTPEHFIKNRTLSLDLLFGWNRHHDVKCVSRSGQATIIGIASRTKTVGAPQKSEITKYAHIWSPGSCRVNRNSVNCFRVIQFSQSVWYISHTPQKEKQRQIFEWKFKTCHLSLKGKHILNWRLNLLEVTRTFSWLILF